MTLQAKCPYCENGCDKCCNGYYEVSFPINDPNFLQYDVFCNDCGDIVGGGFLDEKHQIPRISKYQICPKCFNEKDENYIQNLNTVLLDKNGNIIDDLKNEFPKISNSNEKTELNDWNENEEHI